MQHHRHLSPATAVAGGLLLLGLALTLPRLGASPLWDPWEPRYAQTAREMAEREDWTVPYYRDDPRLVKPPLTYWAIGASHALLGVDEFSSRLPSALLAVLCPVVLGLAFCARGRPLEGFLAGAALLTAPQWILLGRFATPDMPLAAFSGCLMAIAIAAPVCVGRGSGRAAVATAAVVLLAGAALTDWPRGLVLPAWAVLGWGALRAGRRGVVALVSISALYLVAQRLYSGPLNLVAFGLAALAAALLLVARGGIRPRSLLLALAALVLLVLPWFLAAYRAEPAEFAERLLGYKHVLNLGETVGEFTGPPWYVVGIVALGSLPWVAGAVGGLFACWIDRDDDVAGMLTGALIGGGLFFTGSEAQMGHFYGVLQPPVAGLAAIGLVRLARGRRAFLPAAVVAVVGGLLAVAIEPSRLLETANVFHRLPRGIDPRPVTLAAVGLWVLVVGLAVARRRPGWLMSAVLPAAALAAWLGMVLVPALGPQKSCGPMWRLYVEARHPGEPLGTYGRTKDSLFFYSDNTAVRLKQPAEVQAFLAAGEGARYLVAAPYERESLVRLGDPRARWELVDDAHEELLLLRYVPDVREAPRARPGGR